MQLRLRCIRSLAASFGAAITAALIRFLYYRPYKSNWTYIFLSENRKKADKSMGRLVPVSLLLTELTHPAYYVVVYDVPHRDP